MYLEGQTDKENCAFLFLQFIALCLIICLCNIQICLFQTMNIIPLRSLNVTNVIRFTYNSRLNPQPTDGFLIFFQKAGTTKLDTA